MGEAKFSGSIGRERHEVHLVAGFRSCHVPVRGTNPLALVYG